MGYTMRLRAALPFASALFVLGAPLSCAAQEFVVQIADRPETLRAWPPSEDAVVVAQSRRMARHGGERVVIIDPFYTPGNPRCYLKREVADGPQGPVLIYRPVC
jgi:hypothetical protein